MRRALSCLLITFLAVPLASRAAEAPPEEPLLLSSPKQVESLCASLAPVERMRFRGDALERGKAEAAYRATRSAVYARRYRVVVPGRGIVFDPYEEDDEELAISVRSLLTGARGSLRLWAVQDADLAIQVPRLDAQRVLEAQRAGTLTLSLVFDLPDEDETGSPCAHAAGSRVFTVGVEPVAWQYLSQGEVLARGGEGADRSRLTVEQGARPTVEVGQTLNGPQEARRAIAARAKELEACYRAALRHDPSLDGMLVVEVGSREAGSPAVHVSADTMQNDPLATCVQGVVAKAALPRGSAAISVPIHFTLKAPEAGRR